MVDDGIRSGLAGEKECGVIHWNDNSDQLSLSGYWKTPNERALFVGAYGCRHRFHRNRFPAQGRS